MNINLERSKYVKIKGFTEACIESSDMQLVSTIDFVSRSFKHIETFGQASGDPSWDVLYELKNSCMEELERRRGNQIDYDKLIGDNFSRFLSSLNSEDVSL